MNDEDGFHAALEENPDDHITRSVLADWLQERDDPRAAGYRAMAELGLYPVLIPDIKDSSFCGPREYHWQWWYHGYLTDKRIPEDIALHAIIRWDLTSPKPVLYPCYGGFNTLREACDHAARAFTGSIMSPSAGDRKRRRHPARK